jgi:hypothetical protein
LKHPKFVNKGVQINWLITSCIAKVKQLKLINSHENNKSYQQKQPNIGIINWSNRCPRFNDWRKSTKISKIDDGTLIFQSKKHGCEQYVNKHDKRYHQDNQCM